MIHAARGPSNRADRLGRWRRAGGAKRNGSENWAEKNRTGQKAALEACCIVARQNPTKDSSHTARLTDTQARPCWGAVLSGMPVHHSRSLAVRGGWLG